MSNEFAIAAVTITLRNLLGPVKDLSDASVIGSFPVDIAPTAEIVVNNLPLDEAYDFDNAKNQVNIFLYHVEHSSHWRNLEIPGKTKNGESGHPPLGLNLYYIITAYGQNNNEIIGHLLLGKAMSILHDHPLLSRHEIEAAFPDSFLHQQIERVRITPQPISLDDISKLWTGFQTQYKLSVAYQISVVLIESKRAARTPLPVLTRGANDQGVFLQPFVIPPFPTLESAQFPGKQHGVQPGDVLTLKGLHLTGNSVDIKFKHLSTGIENLAPATGSSSGTEMKLTIPNGGLGTWPAGTYSASAIIHKPGEADKTSNAIGIMLLPVINLPIQIAPLSPPVPQGYAATVSFSPAIQPKQNASLLLGDKEFKSKEHTAATTILTFEMRNVEPGDYFIRLRIDGVDSLLVVDSVTPPVFNPVLKVTIV